MRKIGIVLISLGMVLLVGAFGLFYWNQMEAERAARASDELLPQLQEAIPEQTPEETLPEATVETVPQEPEGMTEVEIDGNRYIGYLTIPRLGLELPVMSDWDYDKLKISPCRYSGTIREENLVLLAHNYKKHFGPIRRLEPGDEVIFQDMDGGRTVYKVTVTDVVAPTAVEEITAGKYDLTLVTCTYGGKTRTVVYCDVA